MVTKIHLEHVGAHFAHVNAQIMVVCCMQCEWAHPKKNTPRLAYHSSQMIKESPGCFLTTQQTRQPLMVCSEGMTKENTKNNPKHDPQHHKSRNLRDLSVPQPLIRLSTSLHIPVHLHPLYAFPEENRAKKPGW
jgi:hypothetical protein